LTDLVSEAALPVVPNGGHIESMSFEANLIMVLWRTKPGGTLYERNPFNSSYENIQHAKIEFERRWQLNQEGVYTTETAEDEDRRRLGAEQTEKLLKNYRDLAEKNGEA